MNRLRHLVRDEAKALNDESLNNTRMFTLTDTESPACHGTSFPSLAAARDYAISLREFGLCMSFSVGCYKDGSHIEVYRQVGEEQVVNFEDEDKKWAEFQNLKWHPACLAVFASIE
jgi:hypothetical protein